MSRGFLALCLGLLAAPALAQDTVYSPDQLLARYTHWQDREITIAAFPALFMSPGKWDERWMEFGAEPKPQAPALIVCETLTPPNGDRVSSNDLVILRGGFAQRKPSLSPVRPDQILLEACEVVSIGGEMPEGADPWTAKDMPVSAQALHRAVFDLIGKTVRVRGYYWGKTWSGASDQTRHDIQSTAAFLGPRPIGCFQDGKQDAPRYVMDNRENTVIEGEVALTAHSRPDRVDIENCRFLPND